MTTAITEYSPIEVDLEAASARMVAAL